MDEQRLVGMTNGAKKRAARRDVDDRAILKIPRRSYLYSEARKRYRVGERLQICRWCKGGGGCKSIGAHLQWVNDRFRACDGSGVVRK